MEISPDYEAISLIFTNSFIVETLNNSCFLERFSLFNSDAFIYWELSLLESQNISDQLHNIQNKILDEKHPYRRGIVHSSIIILLYELEGLIDASNGKTNNNFQLGGDEVLFEFQDLLKKHFRQERQVGFYAQTLNLSAVKLNKILSILVGKTAKI